MRFRLITHYQPMFIPMKKPSDLLNRRDFTKTTLLAGAALASGEFSAVAESPRRTRIGVIGCGSVSGSYLPVLSKCPYAQVVSLCDIRPERARKRAEEFKVAHHYPHIDKMLAGEPFEFLINLTDMQEHEHLNRQALTAGKPAGLDRRQAGRVRPPASRPG